MRDKYGRFIKGFSGSPKTQFKRGHKILPCLGKFGKNHPRWKGGKTVNTQGYILILKPNHPFCGNSGYVREHRLVVEKQIGRYLLPKEKCHHLGKRKDNRLCMLMVFVNHSAHVRFERGGKVKKSEIIFDGREG